MIAARCRHQPETLDALGYGAIDIAHGECFGRGREDRHFAGTGRKGRLETLHVRCQRRIAHTWSALYPGHDGGGIGKLRHPFRADEAGDLDALETAIGEQVHQLDLACRIDRLLFVLQAVTRCHLDYRDMVGEFLNHAVSSGRSSRSTALSLV